MEIKNRDTIAYFFRPKNKKEPEAVYVFYRWQQWAPRNLTHIGVSKQPCLYVREMTKKEKEDCADYKRLPYSKYESVEQLLTDERNAEVAQQNIDAMFTKLPRKWRDKYSELIQLSTNEQAQNTEETQ